MSNTEFFTPKNNYISHYQDTEYYTPNNQPEMSDSEESTCSASSASSQDNLSLLAQFDELVRMRKLLMNKDNMEFINFVVQVREMLNDIILLKEENQRLQNGLEEKTQQYDDMEARLKTARKLLDRERREKHKVEEERNHLEAQIAHVREVFFKDDRSKLPDETREKLAFLNNTAQLSAIQEMETTGSLLSNFSYTKSEDDLDTSVLNKGKTWKTHRPSVDNVAAEPVSKKRRTSSSKVVEIGSSDKVRATTTVTVEKDGPITATSIIESIPAELQSPTKPFNDVHLEKQSENKVFDSAENNNAQYKLGQNKRQHCFQSKVLMVPDTCSTCDKRINFGKNGHKCKNCRAVCHSGCKDKLPLPCIPLVNTPTQKGNSGGLIGDYTPSTPPMVPALIVHCVNEIESRGLSEIGLYRIPGSQGEVRLLKERFLKGKTPSLHNIDVHVLCNTIKAFLRSLSEPLIPTALRKDFVRALNAEDEQDVIPLIYQMISELPQPNRDTLACLMMHFKKIAESKDCKMPPINIAKIVGNTIVGFSSDGLNAPTTLEETDQNIKIVMVLMNIPTDYWAEFYYVRYLKTPVSNLQQTPSTDSLLRPGLSSNLYSPPLKRFKKKKFEAYFKSP